MSVSCDGEVKAELLGCLTARVDELGKEIRALEEALSPCLQPADQNPCTAEDNPPRTPSPPLILVRDKLETQLQHSLNDICHLRERIQWP